MHGTNCRSSSGTACEIISHVECCPRKCNGQQMCRRMKALDYRKAALHVVLQHVSTYYVSRNRSSDKKLQPPSRKHKTTGHGANYYRVRHVWILARSKDLFHPRCTHGPRLPCTHLERVGVLEMVVVTIRTKRHQKSVAERSRPSVEWEVALFEDAAAWVCW